MFLMQDKKTREVNFKKIDKSNPLCTSACLGNKPSRDKNILEFRKILNSEYPNLTDEQVLELYKAMDKIADMHFTNWVSWTSQEENV